MRYFAKSVLTTPFWICLDWVGSTLRGEDYTCINYPLKFLSLGGSTSLVVQFQHSKRCTYNKPKGLQSNGEAWSTMECMLQHLLHPRPPAPPPPTPSLDWKAVHSDGWGRYLKHAKGPAQFGIILIGEAWSTKEYQNSTHPLQPPQNGMLVNHKG